MKIIALKGKGNSGKTTTIKLLPSILISNGYSQILNMKKEYGGDFLDIYIKNNFRIGITSSGDTFDLVNDKLSDLTEFNCDICICACRTSDRKLPGTIAATQNFPNYTNVYLSKTYEQNCEQRQKVNTADAIKLYDLISTQH